MYQTGIWTTSRQPAPNIPKPEDWGWIKPDDSPLQPVWMTLPEAATACKELIKCHCKSNKGCVTCSCNKAGLPCTDLCQCPCEKQELMNKYCNRLYLSVNTLLTENCN